MVALVNKINKVRVGEGLFYLLMWGAIYMVPLLNAEMTSRQQLYFQEVVMAWSRITPYFILFVINNNIIAPRTFMKGRHYLSYIGFNVIATLIIFGAIVWFQNNVIQDRFENIQPGFNAMTLTELSLMGNTIFALMMIGANSGIKLIYKSIRDEQMMSELRTHNLQVEMEYLKYQINPHFFMNTLNNIHALIDIDPTWAKGSVIELSKMMRYVLYESGNQRTTLRQDLQFARNYIELMRLRYIDEVSITLNESSDMPLNASIPPLLLIVFIENAFKHGIKGGKESYIDITLGLNGKMLDIAIENSNYPTVASNSSGIGLVNARKRLELIYGNRFKLHTHSDERCYRVELLIPLEDA